MTKASRSWSNHAGGITFSKGYYWSLGFCLSRNRDTGPGSEQEPPYLFWTTFGFPVTENTSRTVEGIERELAIIDINVQLMKHHAHKTDTNLQRIADSQEMNDLNDLVQELKIYER